MKIKSSISSIKSKLIFSLLFSSLFIVSCTSSGDKSQSNTNQTKSDSSSKLSISNDSLDAVVKSILDISATDFVKNQKPLPVVFQNVQLRYFIKPSKEMLYILCGEFATQDKHEITEWVHFTTIKNYDYEQWIGPNGLTYCESSTEIPYSKMNLSIELMKQLDFVQQYGN